MIKFVVVSIHRTGNTLVDMLLISYPSICYDEYFNHPACGYSHGV